MDLCMWIGIWFHHESQQEQLQVSENGEAKKLKGENCTEFYLLITSHIPKCAWCIYETVKPCGSRISIPYINLTIDFVI